MNRTSCALLAAAAIGTALLVGCASGPRPAADRELTAAQRDLELQAFDRVWETVRDKHWDPTLGGHDWSAVRDTLRPRVERARTRAESRAAMQAVLATLGQSHFAVIPHTAYVGLNSRPAGDGMPGLDVRVLDDAAVVTEVEAGSPADSLGVRPGWTLVRVDDKDVAAILSPLRTAFAEHSTLDYMLVLALRVRLRGPVGSQVSVRLRDGAGRERNLLIPRRLPAGLSPTIGPLPSLDTRIETWRLPDGYGYVRVTAFFDPGRVMTRFGEAMASFLDAPGLVLDLRGNPGGIGAMAMGMAGWLVEQEGGILGTMTTRGSQMKFAVTPRPVTYRGPVAVLVDGLSASTAEILAAGLRDLGRAHLFGTRTAGAALPSYVEALPNGDGFQYAVGNYVSQNGDVLEGRGVLPDEVVAPTRAALLAGRDAVLEAATAWIERTR